MRKRKIVYEVDQLALSMPTRISTIDYSSLVTKEMLKAIKNLSYNYSAKTGNRVEPSEFESVGNLAIMEGLRTYDPTKCKGNQLATWIYTKAHQRMMDYCRKQDTVSYQDSKSIREGKVPKKQRIKIVPLPDKYELSNDQTVEKEGVVEMVNKVITCLTPLERTIITQVHLQGLSESKASKKLHMALKTLKQNQAIALGKLRKECEKLMEDVGDRGILLMVANKLFAH